MNKSLDGLSVLTDEHLDYLGEMYSEDDGIEKIQNRIPFHTFVSLKQKIWEGEYGQV